MGGSESRFLLHQKGSEGDRYVTQLPENERLGGAVSYGPRNACDSYQKIVVKYSQGFTALRYDMHPQHYIGIEEDRCVMLGGWGVATQWKLLLFAKKISSENFWCELSTADCNLGYDACKDNSLLVALYHPASKALLRHYDGVDAPRLLPIPLTYMDGDMTLDDRAAFAHTLLGCCWTLECVGSNVSANEMVRPPAIPVIEVGRSTATSTGVPLPRDQHAFVGFGYYQTFETSPFVVVYAGDKMVKHGKGVAADRLENFCFDAGKCGLLL